MNVQGMYPQRDMNIHSKSHNAESFQFFLNKEEVELRVVLVEKTLAL